MIGVLTLVLVVCFLVGAAFFCAACVVHASKPRLSLDELKEIIAEYHDEYGEMHVHDCASEIYRKLTPSGLEERK